MDAAARNERRDIICNNTKQKLYFSVMLKATEFESSLS